MKKNFIKLTIILSIVLLTLIPLSVSAFVVDSGTCGDNLTWTFESNGTLNIDGTGNMNDYHSNTIPWESYMADITDLNISDGVTSIGEYCFYQCKNLETVTISDDIKTISEYAFYRCYKLKDITIPPSLNYIGSGAFSNTYPSIYISDLKAWCSITFDGTIDGPLYLNNELIEELIIPNDVTSISSWAFCNKTQLKSVTLPEGLTYIGSGAFCGCSFESINIPEGVLSIESSTFSGCGKLKAVNIPSTVTSIGPNAFYRCSLTNIKLPYGLREIGTNAFYYCDLTNIIVPDSVLTIGDGAFHGNPVVKISLPFVGHSREDKNNKRSVLGWIFGTLPSGYSSNGYTRQFYSSDRWSRDYYYIPSTLKEVKITDASQIPCGAFSQCFNIESIIILNDTDIIENGTFYQTSIKTIFIPKTVTKITTEAFYNISELTTVFYEGTEEEWNEVYIGSGNESLKQAEKVFNCARTKTKTVNNRFIVTPTNVPNGSTMIFACYNNKQMVYLETFTYAGEETKTFTPDKEYDEVKVMVLDSLKSLIPLCEAENVLLN